MTRDEAMTKLLALGELRFEDLLEYCGWPSGDVRAVLDRLVQARRVTWIHHNRGRWYCLRGPIPQITIEKEIVHAA